MSGNEAQDPPGYDYNGDGVVSWTEALLSLAEIGGYAFDVATFPSGEGLAFGLFIRNIGKEVVKQGAKNSFKSVNKKFLTKYGIKDIHKFKQEFLGKKASLSKFDVVKHTQTNELLIISKQTQQIISNTGKFIK